MVEFFGIVFVVMIGLVLGVLVIFVRKYKSLILNFGMYMVDVYLYIKKMINQILIFKCYVDKMDWVLLIDDFFVNG